ncbi:hypothetical protein [Oceanobacillus salinisoli]|uniref:hypothetical protein n=1 Tax=Oceanobacillus salinisoli TaxID=2678611 RepID=UPI0012E0E3A3|nr:hypothetical protein [Oceanobacillus salinisoli]
MKPLKFEDVAKSMELEVSAARISLAIPPLGENVVQHRAVCIGGMLIKRLIENGTLKNVTKSNWGEIQKSYTTSSNKIICLVRFNGITDTFPLEIPVKALSGHKDAIIQRLRKTERELPARLETWCNETQNDTVLYGSHEMK